jgi:hypothetical protein
MFSAIPPFLRDRWAKFSGDRTAQAIALICLLSFPPAFYYGQLLLRAFLLVLLITVLVLHSTFQSWTKTVTDRLDPTLPPAVAFYRLFLVDPSAQALVFSLRLILGLNVCLLCLGNPLWLPLVDVALGAAFFFTFAGLEELHFQRSPTLARPSGASGSVGGGFRTGTEYFAAHMKNNPRAWGLATLLGGACAYAGKSILDGAIQDRVNMRNTTFRAETKIVTAEKLNFLEVSKAEKLNALEVSKAEKLNALEVSKAEKLNALEVSKAEKLSQLRTKELKLLSALDPALGGTPSPLSPLARKSEFPPPPP